MKNESIKWTKIGVSLGLPGVMQRSEFNLLSLLVHFDYPVSVIGNGKAWEVAIEFIGWNQLVRVDFALMFFPGTNDELLASTAKVDFVAEMGIYSLKAHLRYERWHDLEYLIPEEPLVCAMSLKAVRYCQQWCSVNQQASSQQVILGGPRDF
jgi:hypothetical protein